MENFSELYNSKNTCKEKAQDAHVQAKEILVEILRVKKNS